MKKVLLLITLIWGCFVHPAAAADPDDILTEVIRGIDDIPLLDGRSLFGKEIYSGAERFQLDNIDNEGEHAAHQKLIFRQMLDNRIKKKGYWPLSSNEYYTAEEFLTIYRDLAERACRLNPDALRFFEALLEDGKVYQTPLPELEKQPERAVWFRQVHDLRIRKADATSAALIAIRDDLARRAPAAAPRDDEAATGGATLRHRRHSPADADTVVLHEASGDETDHSTESDPLLGHKEE